MSEERELTPEEASILEDLAEMCESDPEGYEALISADTDQLHGEHILASIEGAQEERRAADNALLEALAQAYRDRAEAEADKE